MYYKVNVLEKVRVMKARSRNFNIHIIGVPEGKGKTFVQRETWRVVTP